MDNPNEIEKIIKSRLNELQHSPDQKVWDRIETQLDQKRKKERLIPVWFQLSGAAVMLIFGIFLLKNYWLNTPATNQIPVVTEEKTAPTLDSTTGIKTSVAEVTTPEVSPQKSPSDPKNNLTSKPNKTTNYQLVTSSKTHSPFFHKEESQVTEKNTLITQQKTVSKPMDSLIKTSQIKVESAVTESDKPKFEPTDKKIESPKNIDETILTEKETLEKSIENEPVKTKKKTKVEWGVKGAPIWYSSLEKGSSLSYALENHQKKSEQTMSYGLSARIMVGDKFKLRTGIHQVNLAYTTKLVTETDALYSLNGGLFSEAFDAVTATPTEVNAELGNLYNMIQNISYWEIPVEIEYPLINKKLSVNLISGFSALLLKDNSVLLNNENLGEVNNLNNTSFTGNLGLGFNYQLSKNWQINLEPTAKIQLNPYNTSTNYKPYFYGLYFGLSHKF